MRRVAVVLVAALLLTACTKAAAPVQPKAEAPKAEPVQAAPQQPGQVSSPTNEPPAVASGPVEADLPVPAALPEGIHRVELAAGQPITERGLYYLDVATGKLEGWLMPPLDHSRPMRSLQSTPDNRWLTTEVGGRGYLIRRSDASAFSYNPERIRVIPGPGVFLLQQAFYKSGDPVRFALVDDEMRMISTFALNTNVPDTDDTLFSPDGKKLAVVASSDRKVLSLVDATTGTITSLVSWEDSSTRLVPLPALNEFVVIHGESPKPLSLERYNWQGQLVGRKQVEGWNVSFTADGSLLAIAQWMGPYGSATAVQEWAGEKPLFRVAGGTGIDWLAGGVGVVVETSRGWQLVLKNGEMQPVQQGGEPRWHPFEWYRPSPDNPDLFLTGTKVVDRSGRTLQDVKVGDRVRVLPAGWGLTSREVQMVATEPLGKGFDMEAWTNFLPTVQRPPFPEKYPLQVAESPGGACLNLREDPGLNGRVIRCLPAGTRLSMPAKPDEHLPESWEDNLLWVTVETEAGDKGWLAASSGSITYADGGAP